MSTPSPHFTHQNFLIESGQGSSSQHLGNLQANSPLTYDPISYVLDILAATTSQEGTVTTAAQTFAPSKSFKTPFYVEDAAGTSFITLSHNGTRGDLVSTGGLDHNSVEYFKGQVSFLNNPPQTSEVPTIGDHLCNKTYVDASMVDYNAYGEMHWQANTTQTSQTTGTGVKLAGTTSTGHLLNFTHTTNRLTYTGSTTRLFFVTASVSIIFNDSSAREEIQILIQKNTSTEMSKSKIRTICDNNDGDAPQAVATQCIVQLAQNDYIEVWAKVLTGGNTPILSNDMNCIIKNFT